MVDINQVLVLEKDNTSISYKVCGNEVKMNRVARKSTPLSESGVVFRATPRVYFTYMFMDKSSKRSFKLDLKTVAIL